MSVCIGHHVLEDILLRRLNFALNHHIREALVELQALGSVVGVELLLIYSSVTSHVFRLNLCQRLKLAT